MNDLETLDPQPVVVDAGGEKIPVAPITIGQLPAFARALRPMEAVLDGGELDWLALMDEHGERVIDMVAIATGKPRDWVTRLPMDDFIRLAGAVLEANLDFFARRLTPAIEEVARRTMTVIGAGPMPSASSTAPATRPTP